MILKKITTLEYGEVGINYNSDYSGLVRIFWNENDKLKEVWIPGVVLLSLEKQQKFILLTNACIEWLPDDNAGR